MPKEKILRLPARINKIFVFDGDQKAPIDKACCEKPII